MQRNSGFTLIELLITTSLTVLLMLTITSMFMTFLVSNSKTNVRKVVKEEGLYAMSQIEFILKNAFYVDEDTNGRTCQNGMSAIDVVSFDGGLTTFQTITPGGVAKIASNSAALTSDAVTLTNLQFDCSGPSGNRQVTVSFDLQKNAPTLNTDASVTESFSSTVNIRN